MIFQLLVGVANSGSLINVRLLQLQVLKSIMLSGLCIPKIYTQYGYTYKYMSACLGQLRQEKNPSTHARYLSHIHFPSGCLGQSQLLQNEYVQNTNEKYEFLF